MGRTDGRRTGGRRWGAWALAAALAFGAIGVGSLASARTPPAPTVAEHVEVVARDSLLAFLQAAGVKEPQVRLAVDPRTDSQGIVRAVSIQAAVVAEGIQPESLAREARLAIQRALVEDGYRLPGDDEADLAPEELAKPIAQVTLNAAAPAGPGSWRERLEPVPVAVFSTLALLSLAGLVLCFVMLGRLWRTLRAPALPAASKAPGKPYEGAAAFPPDGALPPLPGQRRAEPQVDLAPPPAFLPEPAPAGGLPRLPSSWARGMGDGEPEIARFNEVARATEAALAKEAAAAAAEARRAAADIDVAKESRWRGVMAAHEEALAELSARTRGVDEFDEGASPDAKRPVEERPVQERADGGSEATAGSVEEDDRSARAELAQAFAAMPLEKAIRALAAFDVATRTAIIERLRLHPSVRKRIEQELDELARS